MRRAVLLILFVLFYLNAVSAAPARLGVSTTSACSWYLNNDLLEGRTASTILADQTGLYTVVYFSDAGERMVETFYFNAETGTKVRLYVIGDSTASFYDSSRFPRTGWAQIFQGFFNSDSVEVLDYALSGRSSKSFYTDASGWPVVKPKLAAGDYLFIQFGHNDEKDENPALYTEPYTTFKEYLKKYIDEARAVGAIPVLLTPIHRNYWSGTSISDSHGDYPPAMRELAAEENVPLVDLTLKTENLFETYGKDFVTYEFFMNLPATLYKNYPDGNADNTHLQIRGAYEVAKLVARDIQRQQDNPALAKLFRGLQDAGFVKTLVESYNYGTITGDQVVKMGSTTTFKAVNVSGYLFDYFDQDGTYSYENELSLEVNDSVSLITAYFSKAYRVTIKVNLTGKADYSGNGYYKPGDQVTVVAEPDPGYRFLNWTVDDNVVSEDQEYSFVMNSEDLVIYANVEESTSVEDELTESLSFAYDVHSEILYVSSPFKVGQVELFDLNGRAVLTEQPQLENFSLDLSAIRSQIVFIRISGENFVYSQKLLAY